MPITVRAGAGGHLKVKRQNRKHNLITSNANIIRSMSGFFCRLTDDFWSPKAGNTPGGVRAAAGPPTDVSLKYRDINSVPVIPRQLLWTGFFARL